MLRGAYSTHLSLEAPSMGSLRKAGHVPHHWTVWSEVRREARGRAPSYSLEPWLPQRKPGAPLGQQHPMGSTCNHRGIAQAGPFPGPGVGHQPGGRPYTSCVRLEIILCREVGSLVAGIRSGPAGDRDKSDTDGKGLCLAPHGARQLRKRLLCGPCWEYASLPGTWPWRMALGTLSSYASVYTFFSRT